MGFPQHFGSTSDSALSAYLPKPSFATVPWRNDVVMDVGERDGNHTL